MLSMIALPFAVLSIGGSATDIGIVEAAYLVPLAATLLLGGVWADRLPRRAVMLVADVVRAAVQVAIAGLLISGVAEVWHLAALQMLMGAGEAFFRPAYTGLVPQTVSAEHLQQANALSGVTSSGSVTLGALSGGLLVAAVGPGWAIGIDAGTYLLSAWFLLRMRPTSVDPSVARRGFVADLREGWQEFRRRSWLCAMVAGVAVFLMTVQAPLHVLGPVVSQDVYEGARTWGFLSTALGVGQIFGAAIALRWEPRRPLVVVAGSLALGGLPALLLGLGASVWSLLLGGLVLGVVWGLIHPLWLTTLQRQVAPEHLSRVSSYDYLGSLVAYPVGLAAVGPLAAWAGTSSVLLSSALCGVIVSAALLSLRPVRRLRVVPGPGEQTAGAA